MKRKIFTLPRIILFLLLTFIVLHLSPRLSLRTHLFLTGHPKVAFKSEISKEVVYSKRSKLFYLTPSPIHRATGNSMNFYKVTKILIFYITTHHGGG